MEKWDYLYRIAVSVGVAGWNFLLYQPFLILYVLQNRVGVNNFLVISRYKKYACTKGYIWLEIQRLKKSASEKWR